MSAEIRRAAGFALLVAAVVQLPLVVMSVRGADAAEQETLIDQLIAASQLPGMLLTGQPEAPSADQGLIGASAVAEGARSVLPPGVTIASVVNLLVMALIAYLALRTLHMIWPRRTPSRPVRSAR